MALDNPLGFDKIAVGPLGLGIEVEQGSAHSGTSLDVSEPPAVINLLPFAAVTNIVGSSNFEEVVALDTSQLFRLIAGIVTIRKEEVLVLQHRRHFVSSFADSIV